VALNCLKAYRLLTNYLNLSTHLQVKPMWVSMMKILIMPQQKNYSVKKWHIKAAAEYALERGIIIADTKFEFGVDEKNQLVLIDEVLTPDSSRFWPADQYKPGSSPMSFDKQFVRDYLETLDWNKTPPGPMF